MERLEVHDDDLDGAAERHLRADLVLRWDAGADTGGAGGAGGSAGFRGQFRGQFRGRVVRRFRVWADWPVVLQSVVVEPGEPGEPGGGGDGEGDPGGEEDGAEGVGAWDVWLGGGLGGGLDGWALPGGVRAWESVALLGRSDHRDNLVELARGVLFEKETVERRGHLLHLTRWDGSAGLAAMKLAPPPDEQLPGVAEEPGEAGDGGPGRNLRGDFRVAGRALSIRGSGLSAGEIGGGGAAGEAIESYVSGVGLTDGTCGGAAALLRGTLRRLARPRIPERGVAMSNNWGGGGSVGVLSEAFVLAELDAAAVMGLTQVQVDAGWHRGDARALHVEQLEPGSTSATDPDFWAVHPERFPRGLAPIRDRARELGLNWGLWYCLDRADDYTRWRDDLATLLGLWREYGVTHFKFDGVAFTTRLGEMRVRRLLADLYRQTGGQVAASIDITGSKSRRLGLTSGVTHVRDHFVENRYTGNATYRPHRTLRNLWQLARYVPTCRLEMEWLNVHRHPENYRDDPLAPAAFGVEYALAVTLMALPLAWMHLQALPPADAAAARRVLQAVRPHQRAMLHGDVQPIGDEPSGAAWTGFLSTPPDRSRRVPETGYLLLFREVNDADATASPCRACRRERRSNSSRSSATG